MLFGSGVVVVAVSVARFSMSALPAAGAGWSAGSPSTGSAFGGAVGVAGATAGVGSLACEPWRSITNIATAPIAITDIATRPIRRPRPRDFGASSCASWPALAWMLVGVLGAEDGIGVGRPSRVGMLGGGAGFAGVSEPGVSEPGVSDPGVICVRTSERSFCEIGVIGPVCCALGTGAPYERRPRRRADCSTDARANTGSDANGIRSNASSATDW